MKKIRYIYGISIALLVLMLSCNDMSEQHQEWMVDGEINYVGKIDSLTTFGGNERIEFQCYLSDPRVKFLNVMWNDLGVDYQVRVPVPVHEADEMFSFIIGGNEEISENEFSFSIISDDDKKTVSIPFQALGKVYGPKYQQSLRNRLVTSFEEADGGIYLEFSAAINADDQGIELMYNNGLEILELTFTSEDLVDRIFLESPDFSTPISFTTVYKPLNSIDTFKADVIIPSIEKLENIALGKPVISSSNLNDTYVPEKVVDGIIGDNASRWINARVAGVHWIEVDLEGEFGIEKVIVYDDTPVSDFLLEVEVNGVWQDLQVVGNSQKVFTGVYSGINASKIRYSFEPPAISDLVRMFEFEVYSLVKLQ